VISVALKTPLEIRLGICIYKTSLLHRPDDFIGFTPNCPPTFYNKIAPMTQTTSRNQRLQTKTPKKNMSIWPARLSVKPVSKLMSWF